MGAQSWRRKKAFLNDSIVTVRPHWGPSHGVEKRLFLNDNIVTVRPHWGPSHGVEKRLYCTFRPNRIPPGVKAKGLIAPYLFFVKKIKVCCLYWNHRGGFGGVFGENGSRGERVVIKTNIISFIFEKTYFI